MDALDLSIDRMDSRPLLTVDEAASVLRIGRSLAYRMTREYLASGGTTGLPVIRVGACLRVPRWALMELAATGRVVRLCDATVALAEAPVAR
jgi:excisionase family DNA binding protein